MMKVTVNDIARVAKVSQSTVSRVLNNYPQVKQETRKKVLEAIEELKFSPDFVARSMVTNKTNTLGLIVGDISNPFFAESAKIMISRAQEMGYDVIISNTNHIDSNMDHAVQTLLSKRVDGIIISSASRGSNKVKELHDAGFAVILHNSSVEDASSNYVVLDNKKGAIMAMDHLVHLGHEKIAFISGPSKYLNVYQRYAGYQEALEKHGLPFRKTFVYEGEFSYDAVYWFVQRMLEEKERPTAIFATSDQMALAVMDAAAGKGLKIPEDLSVVGFDDMTISSNHYIGLTTISQHKEKMALLALEHLISMVEKKGESADSIHMTLEPELMIRKTTGPPKKIT
ncbi:LacI family transcriptional regulator [Scopulibacillus darangshiensis]|uniref:LacI family transcriptional regulator n=1 Tax=Scopulibacillus darangshiensis TaxID=442528 RepID=A0A4R2P7M7_9BACL|nr:LacI family DNA-binding transcriptional regulator [Scopulibacillus darangshiensis]TCP30940.1 LacI family transcriptional regulator [Scopulibacillus darangshiensis]